MTVTSEKRMLTAPTSKIAKAESIPTLLSQPDAWFSLPFEIRQHLYSLLPPPKEGEAPWDPEVHPMETELKTHIANGLGVWHAELKDGRETKKWRDEALQAGRDRANGKFDAVLGKKATVKKAEKDGDVKGEEE